MANKSQVVPFLWGFAQRPRSTVPLPGAYDDQIGLWLVSENGARKSLIVDARSLVATQTFTEIRGESTDKD